LIEQGKIQVSDKTGIASKTTQSLLATHLSGGDYYSNADNLGVLALTVKAFSWPLLLQSSGLVQINGTKLALKPAGLKANTGQPAQILQSIWTKWLKASDFDEFSRIDTIKGQKTKSRHMSNVSNRRLSIVAALKKCPINEWIALDDFSRFMQAENFSFQVSHDPWKLYICDQEYGNLGYQDSHDWNILQLRYLLCFLFEYAAPLGLIDIAFTSPVGTRHDYGNLWGTEDLDFLSQYDGLHYFKINPLGAYCLQMSAHYQPTSIPSAIKLSLIGDSAIKLVQGSMSGEELLRMEVWSVQESESLWRLNKAKVVLALEQGREISEIINFLQSRDEQPMPPAMENFFKLCSKHCNALKNQGMARIIQCRTQEIANTIEQHPETIKLCQRISELQLLVPVRNEDKFRAATRMLGFGFEGGF
jgi:hypothetical protein